MYNYLVICQRDHHDNDSYDVVAHCSTQLEGDKIAHAFNNPIMAIDLVNDGIYQCIPTPHKEECHA